MRFEQRRGDDHARSADPIRMIAVEPRIFRVSFTLGLLPEKWRTANSLLAGQKWSTFGQLLTYASGLDAVTIVWIAARFTEEHRSTLDWLNKITNESFRFFGLEVELWKLGSSPAAPKFNVVSKPNEWSASVAQAAGAIDSNFRKAVNLG